jgi:hypothetical protein
MFLIILGLLVLIAGFATRSVENINRYSNIMRIIGIGMQLFCTGRCRSGGCKKNVR